MPSPTQSDLHVNIPLTNVSIAYKQASSAYIADKVFPKVPVKKQSDLYWKYSKSDWRRTDVKRRAPSTESPGVGWTTTTGQYFTHVYAVHKDIDDQLRSNADSVFQLDRDATEFVTNQLLLKRDLDWNQKFFKPGVWETEYSGVTTTPNNSQFIQWDNAASDPIGDMQRWIIDFRRKNGVKPNKMVLGAHTMAALKQHPDIIDRIKYTQRGIVSEDLIATLFDIPRLYTSYATVEVSGNQIPDAEEQDKQHQFDFITPSKGALLVSTPDSPSLMTPAAGYTFVWSGYIGGNSEGTRIKRFRLERIASDRIEGEISYDQHVVCPDLGVYIGDAVT
jgi:Phage major capsid protein E